MAGDAGHAVLILSADAVGAALVGALVETLGYRVRFVNTPGRPDDALRRARPQLVMVDCDDPSVMTDETLGHAAMRGVPMLLYGSRTALGRVRQLSLDHQLTTLELPATAREVDEAIRTALTSARSEAG